MPQLPHPAVARRTEHGQLRVARQGSGQRFGDHARRRQGQPDRRSDRQRRHAARRRQGDRRRAGVAGGLDQRRSEVRRSRFGGAPGQFRAGQAGRGARPTAGGGGGRDRRSAVRPRRRAATDRTLSGVPRRRQPAQAVEHEHVWRAAVRRRQWRDHRSGQTAGKSIDAEAARTGRRSDAARSAAAGRRGAGENRNLDRQRREV